MPSKLWDVTVVCVVCLFGLLSAAPTVAQQAPAFEDDPRNRIRILPVSTNGKGQLVVETVVLDKEIARVRFLLDGEEVAVRRKVPFTARFPVAADREQSLVVQAYDRSDRLRGEDSILVGRAVQPLRVRILESGIEDGELRVSLSLSAPDRSWAERVDVSLNGEVLWSAEGDAVELGETDVRVPAPTGVAERGSVLVATLHLQDGRWIDDAVPLGEVVVREELDVRLMQLQLVALDRSERPILGLERGQLRVTEDGEQREVEQLFPAPSVQLLLGLSVDSSSSMARIWRETLAACEAFLQKVLDAGDQAFLVDFDLEVDLVQEATPNLAELREGLASIQPDGITALYDSVVFSLLQFQQQPGRRGLVLITDGVDFGSFSDPKRTIDLAQRFGVPVYVIALQQRGGPRGAGGEVSSRVQALRLLTDPSGGRLFRVGSGEGLARALAQIEAELRSQYVLTYTTDRDIDWRNPPKIEVDIEGHPKAKVKTIFGVDLIE